MYRMPNAPVLTNPDERTIGITTEQQDRPVFNVIIEDPMQDRPVYNVNMEDPSTQEMGVSMNQTTAIRIDDDSVDVRRSWSSAKIQSYSQAKDSELVSQFIANYGELYFSEYDETMYDDWTVVVNDAVIALAQGKTFYVAWSPTRSAQVVGADISSEPRMTVLIDGRSFAMSDVGIQEVPLYNIVLQFESSDNFPQYGSKERLYIDTTSKTIYCWNQDIGYFAVGGQSAMHKLTFGADQQYVYDGSEDVTVPVYMGQYD